MTTRAAPCGPRRGRRAPSRRRRRRPRAPLPSSTPRRHVASRPSSRRARTTSTVDAIRSDLREDREGTLLRLGVRVRDADSCEPIENAIVDVWHCDALGTYSGFESASTGGGGPAGGAGGSTRSDDETYLRGAQATNSDGIVEFRTIYPGWYPGRTTHIHLKVHLDRRTVLTSQLFTNRDIDAKVYAREPYAQDSGRDTFNDTDGIYAGSGELTLSMQGEAVRGVITLDVERG